MTDVLNKVTSGQADAGLVYVTDARSAGDAVAPSPSPRRPMPSTHLPGRRSQRRHRPCPAHRFGDLVTGPAGQHVLQAAGSGNPDPPGGLPSRRDRAAAAVGDEAGRRGQAAAGPAVAELCGARPDPLAELVDELANLPPTRHRVARQHPPRPRTPRSHAAL